MDGEVDKAVGTFPVKTGFYRSQTSSTNQLFHGSGYWGYCIFLFYFSHFLQDNLCVLGNGGRRAAEAFSVCVSSPCSSYFTRPRSISDSVVPSEQMLRETADRSAPLVSRGG